jgi:uncharacterized surface protein with fasciclin (FAS1) repeats
MKKIINHILLLLLVAVSFTACTKDEAAPTAPTFDEFVKANTNLTMFAAAVEKANLKDFTTGPGPFTWFAPTNAAFTAAGITQDSLNRLPAGTVSYLLMYHLVNASYTTQDMIAQNSISRATQLGQVLFNGGFNNMFFVNGGRISSADNKIANGTFHVSERLLTPPLLRGNIQAIIRSTGMHALFEQALTRANLWAQFSTASVFTVMAPTDAAMNAAGLTSTFIAAQTTTAQVAALAARLRYHYFLNVRLFTNDFIADPTTIATAAGPSTSLTTSDNGTKVRGRNNTAPLNITVSDRLGTNGLVHVIDGVLLP